jgi:hypothetical protein
MAHTFILRAGQKLSRDHALHNTKGRPGEETLPHARLIKSYRGTR